MLRYFDINYQLNEETAPAIWEEANQKLASSELSVRSILKKNNVVFVGTTDDPTDNLAYHSLLDKEDFSTTVSPSFRPDKGLDIKSSNFLSWIEKLAKISNKEITTYDDFFAALADRIDYFDEQGCRSSDHGINVMFFEDTSKEEVTKVFEKRLKGGNLTNKEMNQFKTYTLIKLGELYAVKGWVMQLHLSPLRNNNSRMFEILGSDSGFDSIGDPLLAEPLALFLDALDKKDALPKTVLYSLNARDKYS